LVQVDSLDVVIEESMLAVRDSRVALSKRELAVFEILARRPGAVVAKPALLREIWGPEADAHVLEVTVGRLRRRLAPIGLTVKAVIRRGYRLVAEGVQTAESQS